MSPTTPLRLNLIGAGRVGRTLAHLWQRAGVLQVQDVLTRSAASAQAACHDIGAGRAVSQLGDMAPADIWLIATPDGGLAEAATDLARHAAARHMAPAVAWHCSGFWPASVLSALAEAGWRLASTHPAMSFAHPEVARQQFSGTACALEGHPEAVARARWALSAIGGQCFDLQADDKLRYHAAAVLASNFAPVLQAAASELWQGCGMPAHLVTPLWQGFVRHVSDNLLRLGPQAALTGPAARGDAVVVQAQTEALSARDPALGQAYAALSVMAGRLAREGRVLCAVCDAADDSDGDGGSPAARTHMGGASSSAD